MFYLYDQNNSGGSFDYDPVLGIAENVFIEADSADDANDKMESLIGDWDSGHGGYCPCCGGRWYPCGDDDGTETPERYGENVIDSPPKPFLNSAPHATAIHYKDGRVVML